MNKNNSKRLKSRESRGDRIFSGVNVVILLLLCVVTQHIPDRIQCHNAQQ